MPFREDPPRQQGTDPSQAGTGLARPRSRTGSSFRTRSCVAAVIVHLMGYYTTNLRSLSHMLLLALSVGVFPTDIVTWNS